MSECRELECRILLMVVGFASHAIGLGFGYLIWA